MLRLDNHRPDEESLQRLLGALVKGMKRKELGPGITGKAWKCPLIDIWVEDLRESDAVKRVIDNAMRIARKTMGRSFLQNYCIQFKKGPRSFTSVWRWKWKELQRLEPSLDEKMDPVWKDMGGNRKLFCRESSEDPYEKYPARERGTLF